MFSECPANTDRLVNSLRGEPDYFNDDGCRFTGAHKKTGTHSLAALSADPRAVLEHTLLRRASPAPHHNFDSWIRSRHDSII
jgi:hypothetical protein